MKSFKNDTNGFTIVEFLLVFMTLSIIGVAGYFVASNVDEKISAATTNASTGSTYNPITSSTSQGSYVGWNTYTSADKTFSLRYPINWSEEAATDTCNYAGCQEEDWFYPTNQTNLIGSMSVFEIRSTLAPRQFQSANQYYANAITTNSSAKSINGYSTYYFEANSKTAGSPVEAASDVYTLSNHGIIVWIDFSTPSSVANSYKQIIDSIKFTN